MAKKKLIKEELELMSYNDIAHILLKEENKQSTLDIFTKIVELLELPKSTIENKIGEFYTALTNDKRFTMLEDGKWDLKVNHKTKNLTIDEDIEDYEEDEEEIDEYESDEEEDENEVYYSEENEDDDDSVDEYKNLVIMDEDELEEQN